jgi:hypothetical protein
MNTSVETPLNKRRRWRRAELVAAVEYLRLIGLKRAAVCSELRIKPTSLEGALRRAGRLDLWKAIGPDVSPNIDTFDAAHVRHLAQRLFDQLPEEPRGEVEKHRRDLLAEDSDVDGPKGHRRSGPGGVVRWVAA